jgi:hypothetical protein
LNVGRFTAGAGFRISSARNAGSLAHLPHQTRLPPRRTDIAVSFNDTPSSERLAGRSSPSNIILRATRSPGLPNVFQQACDKLRHFTGLLTQQGDS